MTDHIRILATIETDPTRYHGEAARYPRAPGRQGCEQVLSHLATDLGRLFPAIERCDIAMAGTLFDQTQIVRPGYPVHAALEDLLEAGGGARAVRLAVAAEPDRPPDERLQPDPAIPPGLLQILPLTVRGRPDVIGTLADAMEHQFLEQGQLSAHSAKGLESQFGIAVTHARFMTLTDLLAMLRLQLEHFGFLPLWDLLYCAITADEEPREARGRQGQQFEWRDGAVHCRFETFDFWARDGSGADIVAKDGALAQGYSDWSREYRQYLTTLSAHAVPLLQHAPGAAEIRTQEGFLVEESPLTPTAAAEVTEHASAELGTLAITVIRDGRQLNYYPLSPRGLNTLHARLRSVGLGPGGFAYPGHLVHDPETRRLMPDAAPPEDD